MLCSEKLFNKAFIKKNKNEKLIKYFKRSSSNEDEIRKLRQENDELIKIINERNLVKNDRGSVQLPQLRKAVTDFEHPTVFRLVM